MNGHLQLNVSFTTCNWSEKHQEWLVVEIIKAYFLNYGWTFGWGLTVGLWVGALVGLLTGINDTSD